MRLLFGFFLLLNIAYFVWQMDYFTKPEPGIIKDEVIPEGVERLVLLRERGLGSLAGDQTVRAQQPSAQAKDDAPTAVPDTQQQPEQVASGSTDDDGDTKPVDKTATPIAEPEPEPPQVIQLACFTLGPFGNEESVGKAAEAISALDVKTHARETELRVPKNYWVYLPQESYNAARKTVKALQAKGIKDLFIMGKGENKDDISLGLFSNENTARQRMEEVTALGFKPRQETQYQITMQKWLDFEVDSKRTSTVATITAIAEDYRGTTLTQRDCE